MTNRMQVTKLADTISAANGLNGPEGAEIIALRIGMTFDVQSFEVLYSFGEPSNVRLMVAGAMSPVTDNGFVVDIILMTPEERDEEGETNDETDKRPTDNPFQI